MNRRTFITTTLGGLVAAMLPVKANPISGNLILSSHEYMEIDYMDKVIKLTGGPVSLNKFYSDIQDIFDEPAQMDDFVPVKALCRHAYKMDNEWELDPDTLHFLELTKNPEYDSLADSDGKRLIGG